MLTKTINWTTLLMCYLLICYPDVYAINLFRSFTFQISIFTSLLVVYYLIKKDHIHYGIAVTSTLICVSTYMSVINQTHSTETKDDFSVAHFNVLKFNNDYDSVIKSALKTDATLLSFQETNANWDAALGKALSSNYPYLITFPQENCCFGISVYSKTEIVKANITMFGGHPNLTGTININDTPIQFVCAHTSAPTSDERFRNRNNHIKELSKHLCKIKGPVFLIGDFNSVPWDTQIHRLKHKTGLIDSRADLCPTFPASLKALMIPIDYIFHSKQLSCSQFKNINTRSSDHFGVVGRFRLNKYNL